MNKYGKSRKIRKKKSSLTLRKKSKKIIGRGKDIGLVPTNIINSYLNHPLLGNDQWVMSEERKQITNFKNVEELPFYCPKLVAYITEYANIELHTFLHDNKDKYDIIGFKDVTIYAKYQQIYKKDIITLKFSFNAKLKFSFNAKLKPVFQMYYCKQNNDDYYLLPFYGTDILFLYHVTLNDEDYRLAGIQSRLPFQTKQELLDLISDSPLKTTYADNLDRLHLDNHMLQYIFRHANVWSDQINIDNQINHGNNGFIYRRANADQNMRIMNMVNEMLFDFEKNEFIDKLKEITRDLLRSLLVISLTGHFANIQQTEELKWVIRMEMLIHMHSGQHYDDLSYTGMVLREGKDDNERLMKIR